DLAAPQRGMRDLGTLGNARTRAIAVDGTRVAGEWVIPQRGTRAFAYDLSAVSPRLLDLGTWDGRSMASDIDGKVVVGRSAQHATAWVLRNTSQPMFAFRHFDRRVKEGAGRVTIRVTRYGRTDRDVTVRYRTRSDTAKAGQDFVATSGKLRFARGVTQRKLQVRIIDDRRREGNEHLLLTLSRPSSPALLGSPHWSQLLIKANDR
ncbi:Calx-beta domain-containing protein, partial [Nocardioides sp.]|uniref:Calx-beta domain-containing protein n=1 Tax=Nocardioides sp. TaxID=35761 RepID=UPI002736FB0F